MRKWIFPEGIQVIGNKKALTRVRSKHFKFKIRQSKLPRQIWKLLHANAHFQFRETFHNVFVAMFIQKLLAISYPSI